MSTSKVASSHWDIGTTVIITFALLLVFAGLASFAAQPEKYVSEKEQIFAAHVSELKSFPTTSVVVPYGHKGIMSYYWGQSGLSHKYTLDEYKAAIVAPYGADISAPVQGDHFTVPWLK